MSYKKSFVSFANKDSNFSLERIKFEAHEMGVFDEISCYTEDDIDSDYMKKYGNHFNHERGYGYWSWKPYFLKKKLSQLNDGDIIVYADCGCMFLYENRGTLLEWFNRVLNSKSGILSPCFGPYLEREWTRCDLYDYINKTYNKDGVDIFNNAVQCGCGILILCKNKQSEEFIDKWNDVMSNHFDLCTDAISSIPNHKDFKENRHDQSVFSMLSKIYGIETIETSDGILNKEKSPIIAARIKNDKKTWKKPIKVLFDSQVYDLQEFGGISRMYVDLYNNFNRNDIVEMFPNPGANYRKYQEFAARFSISSTNNFYLKNLKPYRQGNGGNKELSVKMIKEGDYDILYPTYFNTYFLKYLDKKPFVMSVHDMIPELYPQFFSRNDLQIVGKKEMVKYASAIEVPTQTTKRDLISILGVDETKIHVVGRGIDNNFGRVTINHNPLNTKYVLYVGQRGLYKRFDWFVKHASTFFNKHKDIVLVCVGKKFTNVEFELLKKYDMSDKAYVITPNDVVLATLYKYAEFFVFPSEYEGFGLPVLESYKMNCIALLNNNDCFNEITFGKGTFFDLKENESNIVEVMENTLLLTKEEKEEKLRIQHEIFSHYSIEKTALKIKEMIKCAIGEEEIIELNKKIEQSFKISIITINFNNKDGLERTIKSVINQTFFNRIEYIVIDGDSTDGSKDVLEKYRENLSCCISEKDSGIYNAMNKGIGRANGEYVLFLNSGDEFYTNDAIEKCYYELDKDIVYGDLLVASNGRSFVKKYPDVVTPKYMAVESLPHPSSFIKLNLLKKEKYIEEYKIVSDWAFFFKKILLDKCSYKHIGVVVSKFYLGGASSDANKIREEKRAFLHSMMEKPKITIIMPCYNYSKYITETINSLKASTYKNWQCIIVNDGSKDNSEDVIYSNISNDNRFTYIKQPNKGVGAARNIGIRASNTKYIMCLDPDDKISSTYIENGIKYLDEHDDCTLYYGNANMFYDDGTEKKWKLRKFDYKKLLQSNHIYSSFIYRKSDYEAVGGYDEKLKGYEDWDFIIRLLYGGKKVYMTDDVVFYYRRHDGSKDAVAKKNIEQYKKYIYEKNKEIYINTLKKAKKELL